MARRRKTTPFEDLIHLASLLPWWLALTLAPLASAAALKISLE